MCVLYVSVFSSVILYVLLCFCMFLYVSDLVVIVELSAAAACLLGLRREGERLCELS